MISLINPFDKTSIRFDIPPQHVIVIPINFEQRFEFIDSLSCRKYPLEVTYPMHLFF